MSKIIQPSLFPEDVILHQNLSRRSKAKERWQNLKNKNFGIELCRDAMFSGKYGIPKIAAYHGPIPVRLTTFNEINSLGDLKCGVTFFNHDYLIERFWYSPDAYLSKLSHYHSVCEPDLSLRANTPLGIQIANTYRNNTLAYFMAKHGLKVIPSMSWGGPSSFEFCFDGHERGGVVIVSTVGVLQDERAIRYFIKGFDEMLKRISPDCVLFYGEVCKSIQQHLPTELDVRFYENLRFLNLRNHGRKRCV